MSVFVPHRRPVPAAGLLLLALSTVLVLGILLPPLASPLRGSDPAPVAPDLEALPLSFVPNVGQTDPAVQFQAQSLSGTVFFTAAEVVLSLPAHDAAIANQSGNPAGQASTTVVDAAVVRIEFDGASAAPTLTGAKIQSGTINYLQGDDPAQWRTEVPTYAGVVYQNLYDGIDLFYDGTHGNSKAPTPLHRESTLIRSGGATVVRSRCKLIERPATCRSACLPGRC